MGEKYASKLARRMRLLRELPPELQNIPVRYIEAAAALEPHHKKLLSEALAKGVGSPGPVLEYLQQHPEASLEEILAHVPSERRRRPSSATNAYGEPTEQDIETLADLLGECFPGMPPLAARALAESQVMSHALEVGRALRLALEASSAKSDFVIVALYALVLFVKERLDSVISSNPAFVQAVRQSGLAWEENPNE